VIVVVPAIAPETTPVLPTVAVVVELELQVPPALTSVNGVEEPAQTVIVPVIADGNGFTVSVTILKHPPGKV
jgi:hypothetical protein